MRTFARHSLPVIVLVLSAAILSAQNLDINVVKRDYDAIPYALRLSAVTDAAQNESVDAERLKASLESVPDITVGNINTGRTAQILDEDLASFLTVPEINQDILFVEVDPNGQRRESLHAYWGPVTHQTPTAKTVGAWLGSEAAGYPRYISPTVTIKFQGRSLAYKALYLVRADGSMFPADVMCECISYSQFQGNFSPDELLRAKGRNSPLIRSWIAAHASEDPTHRLAQPEKQPAPQVPQVPLGRTSLTMSGPVAAAEGACQFMDPQDCICNTGENCTAISLPHSNQPSITCDVFGYYRPVYWNGIFTKAYHTWMQDTVHSSTGGQSTEAWDAGPTGNCFDGMVNKPPVNCGYLNDCVLNSAFGCLVGDIVSNSKRFFSSLLSHWPNETSCDTVVDMQNFEWTWVNNQKPYDPGYENSNTWISLMMSNTEGGLIPAPPVWTPGWATF